MNIWVRFYVLLIVNIMTIMATSISYSNDLNEELSYLFKNNPQIKEAGNLLKNKDYEIIQANALFFPKLNLNINFGRERVDNNAIQNEDTQGSVSNLFSKKATADISYNLFDGYGKEANLAKIKISKASQSSLYKITLQAIISEALKTYIKVKELSKHKEYSKQGLEIISTGVDQQHKMVEQGAALSIDLLQAQSRQSLAYDIYLLDSDILDRTIANYERLFSRKPNISKMTELSIIFNETPSSLEDAIAIANQNNPTLKYSKEAEKEAEKAIIVAKSGFYPKLNIVGMVDWEKNIDGSRKSKETQSLMLKASWNLFDGYATSSAEKIALYERYAARDRKVNQQDILENQVKDAWSRMKTALIRIERMNDLIKLNQTILQSQKTQIEAGRETSLALIEQQTMILSLLKEAIQLKIIASEASLDLLQATGALNTEMFK